MLAERVDEWTQKWKREGLRRLGERKGKLEGKLEGKTDALKRLLRGRFGELPPWAQARIEAAAIGQLDTWLDHLFQAETLETLLGDGPAAHRPPVS